MLRRVASTAQQPIVKLDLDLGATVSESNVGTDTILSPDGTRLVFVSQGADGKSRLSTRRLDQPKPTELPGTNGAYGPFFSPDGLSVGFFAGGKLKKIVLDGGDPVILCDAPAGRGATWSEDGSIIASLEPVRGGDPFKIARESPLNLQADLANPYSVSGFRTRMRWRVASSGTHTESRSNSSASSGL
jgi:Tol biopolymer transport system component